MFNQKIDQILEQIKDPKEKQRVLKLLTGKVITQIRCQSDTCKGRVIGLIYDDNSLEAVELRDNMGELVSGAMAIRFRYDGNYGVECACGADTRIAEQESDNLIANGQPPINLEEIYQKVQTNPTPVQAKGDKLLVDGFIFEKVN